MKSLRRWLAPILTVATLTGVPLTLAIAADASPPITASAERPDVPALGSNPAIVPAAETAPELPPFDPNPKNWFDNPLVFAGAIAAVVAFLRANFLQSLAGLQVVALSLGLGIAFSVLGTFELPIWGRVNDRSLADAALYGLQCAVIASGGWDLIKALILAVFSGKQAAETGA